MPSLGPGRRSAPGRCSTDGTVVGDDAVVAAGRAAAAASGSPTRPEEHDAGVGHGWCRVHRLDARRPPARRGPRASTWSTTCRAARSPTSPRPGPIARHELKVHQVDIRDAAVVELIGRRQPEVIFHLAAQADVRVSVARPAFDAEVNVLGSINVLEGARIGGTRKVVFASSGGTIYGEPAAGGPAGQGVAPAAAAVALRRGQEGRHRLPPRLPGAPRRSSSRRWRWPTSTAPGRTRTARRAWWRSSPACSSTGSLHDLRRRRPDPRLRLRRRRRRRLRAGGRPKGSGLLCNIGTGVETSVNELYAAMAAAAGRRPSRPSTPPARAGRAGPQRPRPGRAGLHLGWEPWTDLATGAAEVLRWFGSKLAPARSGLSGRGPPRAGARSRRAPRRGPSQAGSTPRTTAAATPVGLAHDELGGRRPARRPRTPR